MIGAAAPEMTFPSNSVPPLRGGILERGDWSLWNRLFDKNLLNQGERIG